MDPNSVAALNDLIGGIVTVFIVIFGITAPVWLLSRYLKYRGEQKTDPAQAAALERMGQVAQRMEQRMAALERILDAEAPRWRETFDEVGGRYEHTG